MRPSVVLPFDPTTVVASPTLWLTGRLGVTDTGTFTWADQSGNARNVTKGGLAGTHPTVDTGGPNGFNGVAFAQSSSQTASGTTLSNLITASADTSITVFKINSADVDNGAIEQNDAVWSDSGGWTGLYVRGSTDNDMSYQFFVADDATINLGTWTAGKVYIATHRHSGGTSKGSINGGAEITLARGNLGSVAGTFQLGLSGAGSHFFNGVIYEHVMWNTDIGATNLAAIVAGYKTMYAIT